MRGHLAELNGFPALVSGRHGRVDGELVHVTDPALWERLDTYEGVGEPGWYARGLVVALDQVGEPRSAWAYMVPAPGKAATE